MLTDTTKYELPDINKLNFLNSNQDNQEEKVFNCMSNVLNDFVDSCDKECICPVPVESGLLTGSGFEYDPQASITVPNVVVPNVVAAANGQCEYKWFDNMFTCGTTCTQPVVRVYDNEKLHCHTALIRFKGDHQINEAMHTFTTSGSNQQTDETNCTMSVTTFSKVYNGNWAHIVYLQSSVIGLKGFYLWDHSSGGGESSLIAYGQPPQGMLTITDIIHLHVVPVGTTAPNGDLGLNTDPGLIHDNYLKDCRSMQYYGHGYEEYMINIIDNLIDGADSLDDSGNMTTPRTGVYSVYNQQTDEVRMSLDAHTTNYTCTELDIQLGQPKWAYDDSPSLTDRDTLRPIRDFHYPNKFTGYLAQEATAFEFVGPDRPPVDITSIEQLIAIADIIRNTHVPNYRAARIPIKSGLNVEAWESHLQGYSDKRVLQYIKFGYPLSIINAEELCNKDSTNHYSARQYPSEVQKYIDKEKSLGALLGPVSSIVHPHYHCSPLMTRPKDNGSRRVILDLSYPRGNSVNSHVQADRFDNSAFVLKFPNIDHITEDIVRCTDDCVLSKIDVARAFRNLRVDPVDSLKLGIMWNGNYYADLAVAFGWTHGSAAFQILSDAIAHIVAKAGIKLHCYIDDYIAVVPKTKADEKFKYVCDLLSELGLPLNYDKLTPPTKRLTCLGIDINIDNNTMSISEDKLRSIHEECIRVSTKKCLSRRAFQSLLGKLLYIQKCVKPSRVFLNRILALYRANSHLHKIYLSSDFHKDIAWFLTFLPSFNGTSYLKKNAVDSVQSLYLDACLTGMGGVWRDRVYATPIHNMMGVDLKIVHLEMLNLVIALRTWASHWCHSSITVHCDNSGVVFVVKTGKTKDPFLALCVRNIWLLTAHYDIHLDIVHIPGRCNTIADTLSRIYSSSNIDTSILCHLRDHYIWERIPSHYFDLDLHL